MIALPAMTGAVRPVERRPGAGWARRCRSLPRISLAAAVLTLMAAAMLSAAPGPTPPALPNGAERALDEGVTRQQSGDAPGALAAYRRALQAADATAAERARALMGLAAIEYGLGHYADGSRHAAEAATLFEGLRDNAGLGGALNRRGVIALYSGDYPEADRLLTAALARASAPGDREARAQYQMNLANVRFFVGRYADAARLYDEALAVTNLATGEPWSAHRRRLILINKATLYQQLGLDQEALDVYGALETAQDELSPRERGEMLVNLGVLYRHLGDPLKALRAYDEARTLFARERAVDAELGALTNRGVVLALDLGQLDEAERTFASALGGATTVGNRREMLQARLYLGETRRRGGRASAAREDFAAGLVLARELNTPEEEWRALYGLGQVEPDLARAGRYLTDAVNTIEAIREAIRIPPLRSDFLADKRVVYDALIAARLETAGADVTFGVLERSHSRVWRDRLGLSGAIDLASVQRAMPDRLLLLDYWQSAQGSAVVAVTRQHAAVIRLDVRSSDITALIDTTAEGPTSSWRARATAVADRVLPPSEWFDGVDRVVVVPDGAVALVPFDILPIDGRLLIERAAVSYAPTAATLLQSTPAGRTWLPPWRVQLRVFADPAVAADEARQVAGELAGRTVMHLGADNRKADLFSSTEQSPLLHLATHAVADASAMEQSRMVFSSPTGSGTDADYLYLKEAYRLPLRGVELAVLSACDTARGRMLEGEGVQSFSRAFLAAGARSTVTTMWRVADRPTADFMQVFYHHLQSGLPRDEALRRAKLRFLESGSALADPHFWGAFVLTGDGLHPIPRAMSLRVVAAASLATLLVLGVTATRYRARRAIVPPDIAARNG